MPHTSPLSRPLDLALHIGSGKTGTSSIQAFLQQNRARLADLGVLYPRAPGARRHFRLSVLVRPAGQRDEIAPWDRKRFSSPAAFRRRLLREIEESGLSRVLLSDEGLYGSPDEALRRLGQFTGRIAESLRLVVYLRRQDDHLVSRYQQVVKVGETRRLADWADRQGPRTYDYDERLRTWQRLVGPTQLVVRRFERSAFTEGSLHQDFLDAAGIEARADEFDPIEPVNESLDAESVELMRVINILREQDQQTSDLLPNNHVLVTRLAAASTGPTLTMPETFLDAFMARWEQSNQRVARDLLGEGSGELFRSPRKTRHTTTQQHLDPGRLEHFLDLLDLPEQTHGPLHAQAEREAG
jgi:hypothetical protein